MHSFVIHKFLVLKRFGHVRSRRKCDARVFMYPRSKATGDSVIIHSVSDVEVIPGIVPSIGDLCGNLYN